MRQKNELLMLEIREYVERYALNHGGTTPSTTQIAKRFDISRAGAYRYLTAMDEKGMIEYRDGTIHTAELDKINRNWSVGYMEGISAGEAYIIDGTVSEYFIMPSMFTDNRKGEFFAVKVSGDSMKDAGISPEDVVICQKRETANIGDIIVAYIRGSGATLKRLCKDDDGVFLRAENNSWSIDDRMFGREFDVQGVAIKVIKDINFKECEREDGGR